MAKSRVKLNINERALKKIANDKVSQMTRDLTTALNALTSRHQGKPIDEVKRAIQDVWSRKTGGGSITDPELTQFAEQIAAGGRVTVRMK